VGVRELLHARPAPEFAGWLERVGIFSRGRLSELAAQGPDSLAVFADALKAIER
jgi:ethanolamine ammonia-lyase large subunit